MIRPLGGMLTSADLDALAARWIDPETAAAQFLRRVDAYDGAQVVGRNGGDFSGVVIPNVWPGSDCIREYRLRRDRPDTENGKVRMKYVAPPGRANLLYFPVGTDPSSLADPQLPLLITEGEFKTIALDRLARHGLAPGQLRFLAAGLAGVWNWRGTIGKTQDANGHRIDVKGAIPDLGRVVCDDRRILIAFDADQEENESVRIARFLFTKELRSRGARVSWFNWPADRPPQAKGVDDLLAAIGPERVLRLIEAALERTADPPDLIPFHFADTGNADRLVMLHGANLRYCFAFKKWMIWDSKRWVVDETGTALKLAKDTIISFLRQAGDAKNKEAESFARASLDARRLRAMLDLAQPELPLTPAELDSDGSLLNFTNGTINLQAGVLHPHRRGDFITRLVTYPYRPQASCPRWLAFLAEIMGGGPDASEAALERADELVAFLKAALGYSITGEVSEKAVFVACGSGDNGKTTMLSTVRAMVRDYAVTIGLDVLTAKDDSNNVLAARARLLGVRFASSSETEEGQRLSAARLKRICQGPGGEIEACKKYENPFTFRETHTLWIDANYRPELPPTDAAVWNRIRLIPFNVTFAKDQQDGQLRAKLLEEGEGILRWLVEGAKQWYARGLPQSKVVDGATKAWQKELDRLHAYLDECTERASDAQAWLLNKVLYEAYKTWCAGNGERFLSQVRFGKQMEAMNFKKGERTEQGNIWLGIRFKRP